MQKINIYIDVYHTGNLKHGTGEYVIVLEYISLDGKTYTKEYIEGVKNTTLNRTALQACITALQHMIKKCEINFFLNSEYVSIAINSGAWYAWLSTGLNAKKKPAKNLDLWEQLFNLADKHITTWTYKEKNPYTECMKTMMKKSKIEYKEDNADV